MVAEIVDENLVIDKIAHDFVVEKLIENEKSLASGEKIYSKDEMNTIIDWTFSKYV